MLVCLVFLFTFPAFPEQAKWLTEPEREYVKARLRADLGHNAAERKVTLGDVLTVLRDPKVIVGGFMYFGLIVPACQYHSCPATVPPDLCSLECSRIYHFRARSR